MNALVSALSKRLIVVALGVTAVLGTVAATKAAMPCVTMMGVVTRLPPCCAAMQRTDRVTVPGGDCCQNGQLAEHTPAQSAPDSAPPGPAAYVIVPAAVALVAPEPASRQHAHARNAVERPPPLDSPSQGEALLV